MPNYIALPWSTCLVPRTRYFVVVNIPLRSRGPLVFHQNSLTVKAWEKVASELTICWGSRRLQIDLFRLGGLFSHYRPRDMHTTIWKFERKNSQEYHHMVWNGATNHPVEKGLLSCPPLKETVKIVSLLRYSRVFFLSFIVFLSFWLEISCLPLFHSDWVEYKHG